VVDQQRGERLQAPFVHRLDRHHRVAVKNRAGAGHQQFVRAVARHKAAEDVAQLRGVLIRGVARRRLDVHLSDAHVRQDSGGA
jgi:hypothetical protein